ncbi:type II toxin-antitoxin system RelE family toxin [Thermodesulfatator atlanticus]|uniref:type II toxin-antitoxin system RelE family toxin n=1 Tax=Thermodesulfatator atlanticus TaxID=501497 RepID=UPI0003B550CF|nr:hypothetical protein [Thermodesulfatator atlanticus]
MTQKTFKVKISQDVLEKDFPALNPGFKEALINFIKEKLAVRPHLYAKPVRGPGSKYWKVRFGEYLLGFKIELDCLIVLAVIPYYRLYNKNFVGV